MHMKNVFCVNPIGCASGYENFCWHVKITFWPHDIRLWLCTSAIHSNQLAYQGAQQLNDLVDGLFSYCMSLDCEVIVEGWMTNLQHWIHNIIPGECSRHHCPVVEVIFLHKWLQISKGQLPSILQYKVHPIPKYKCSSSRLAVVLAQSIEAWC